MLLGSQKYDKSADVANSIIVAENPHEEVDGFPMADPSIVVNPKQAYREKYGVGGNDGWSPYDNGDSATGNPCFVDLPMWQHGEQLNNIKLGIISSFVLRTSRVKYENVIQ